MNFYRSALAVFLSALTLTFTSCTGTSKVSAGEKENKNRVYPGWYNANQSFIPDSAHYTGYATALAGDSSDAARKAITHAEETLKSGVSERLESIRKKAAGELDNSSGLNTPGFILTLRNAEINTTNAAKRTNVEVGSSETYSGYRGFAETVADKKALLKELDEAMAKYKTAWNAMKTSQAFSQF